MNPRLHTLSLALVAAALLAGTARAGLPIAPLAPPAAIVNIESNDELADVSTPDARVVYARTAAPTAGDSDGWWLRLDVTVANQSGASLTVTGFTVDTDVSAPVAVVLDDPVAIGAHKSANILLPNGIAGDGGPMPDTLGVQATIQGYAQPVQRVAELVEYEAPTPSGGYRFPGRSNDLAPGVFWSVGAHAHNRSQRYAYDFGNSRWDGAAGEWTRYTPAAVSREGAGGAPAGTYNADSLIWGRPVYALANATLVRCWRSRVDNDPGESVSGGGNTVILYLGNGLYAAYYHLRKNSVPAALCPFEGEGDDGDDTPLAIPVEEGQMLGRVGNTGHSSGPHLHFQLTDTAGSGDAAQRGLPLRFKGIRVHGWTDYDPEVDLSPWNQLAPGESAVPVHELILPPCGGPSCAITH